MIKDNLKIVNQNIIDAVNKSNRSINEVKLIAVSKTKPVEMLKEVYDEGVRDFGENKVQEILDKYDKMPKDTRWHMIGHLQTNKVKYIIDKVVLIHSVDTLKLAETISKEAIKHNIIMPVLLEVNIAKEESKFGIYPEDVLSFYEEAVKLPGIVVEGLMTVAPFVSDPEENRKHFKALNQLSVDIIAKKTDNRYVNELSMGMTGDYEVAISEGATYVRVGTGIFGERVYNI